MNGVRRRQLLVAALAWLCLASATIAAPPPRWSDLETSLGSENYSEAKRQADFLLQRSSPPDRQRTAMVYGRILLGLGQKEQAKQFLNAAAKSGGGAQIALYTIWLTAMDKPEEGIRSLEKMLEKADRSLTTAEAADILAMLYLARGERENAKKAVDFGLGVLNYMKIKDGYVLALLNGRLNSDVSSSEAKRMYDRAEKLRADNKFAEAGQLFAQVRATYPKDQWAHASGFRIGQCYLGLNRVPQAEDWWQTFIKDSPGGPWRGQAHVALVDTSLLQLDLAKAMKHVMSATAAMTKGFDKDAEPSWKDASYEINLRQGIVSLVDGRFDAAAEGFQQAKLNLPSSTVGKDPQLLATSGKGTGVAAGLDRLIDAAQKRAKMLPDELNVGDDRAATALALGNIYNVLHQYDLAKGFFALPLNGPMRSKSAGHRSFAGLGLAHAVIGSGQPISSASSPSHGEKTRAAAPSAILQAKTICEASLAEYPKGSWHDETLYRLATIIQDQAEAKFGKSSKPTGAKDGNKANQPVKPSGSPEHDAKVEKERFAVLVKAKSEALPYWQQIIKRYPDSPRCEQALYYAGVLLYEMAETSPDEKRVDQMWKDATEALSRFCKAYSQSPYAGAAYARQIDIALERMFAPKVALGVSATAGEWAKWAIGGPMLDPPKSDAWALVVKYPDKSEIRRSVYDCLLRLGLVAYLVGDFDKAEQWIDIAGPKPPTAGFTTNPDMESLTLYCLQKAIRSKKPITEPRALEAAKTNEQRLLLQLGDLYLETIRPNKAEKVFLRIIEHDPKLGKVSVNLEGYAMLQIATSLDCQLDRRPEALAWLKDLATRRDLQGTYWDGYGMFCLALFTYNQTQDPKQSMPLYLEMLKRYPKHEKAELAHLYYCLEAIQLKNSVLADKASQSFFAKYPKSEYRSLLEKKMDALVKAAGNNNTSR